MVASRFHWLAIGLAALVFAPLLAAPYHTSEQALRAAPGWLYLVDFAPWISRGLHLALHLAAVWLTAGLFRDLLRRRAARIAIILYALHPLQTETLASLEARPLLLAAVLSLAALRYWRRGNAWAAVSCGTLAAFADWSAVALPLLLWLWSSKDHRREAAAPLGVLSGVGIASVIHALGSSITISAGYMAWQGVAVLRTFGLFVLPLAMSADPDVQAPPLVAAWAWGAVAAVATLVCLHRAGPWRWCASALIALAPTSCLLASPQLAADPRAALALVFLSGGAGWLLAGSDHKLRVTATALLALVSLMQANTWRSERAVWIEAARLAPAKVEPRIRLAPLIDANHALQLLEGARTQAPEDPAVERQLTHALQRTAACAPSAGEACANSPEPSR
jgi:hypothetical protein